MTIGTLGSAQRKSNEPGSISTLLNLSSEAETSPLVIHLALDLIKRKPGIHHAPPMRLGR